MNGSGSSPRPGVPSHLHHDDKERVRGAVDITELIGSYIDLRRQGRHYVGLCPWHDDSKPSLNVNPDRQSWKCWVCDIGGDVFSFVMRREGLEFVEALRFLADRAGIQLSRRGRRSKPGDPNDKQTLLEVLSWAESQYRDCLLGTEGKAARSYLTDRGLDEACSGEFRVGYSPSGWQWLLDRARNTNFTEAHLANVGLIGFSETSRRHYDRFRERVMFAIHDVQGRTVGFGGRILPGNTDPRAAKYINSPDTQIFTKSDHLYGLDLARDTVAKDRHVVIVEGYTDVMMARQHGLGNVVAVLGTALGERHVGLLKRFADRVTLVLDGDEAGQRRSTEILELFVQGAIDLRIATLPDGLDPCDFISERGADAFDDAVDGAVDALEFKIRTALNGIDVRRDTHASNKALEEILRTIGMQNPPSSTSLSAQQLRIQQLLGQLSRRFRVDEHDLRERLRGLRGPHEEPGPAVPAVTQPEIHDWEDELFGILLKFPQLAAEVLPRLRVVDLQSPASQELLAVYRELIEANQIPDFDSLILLLEERLKSILVSIDERASKRSMNLEAAITAIEGTVAAFERKRDDADYQSQVEELDSQPMTEAEQLAAFQKLLDAQRTRRGISTPTDG